MKIVMPPGGSGASQGCQAMNPLRLVDDDGTRGIRGARDQRAGDESMADAKKMPRSRKKLRSLRSRLAAIICAPPEAVVYMRKGIFCALLLAFLPALADESAQYRDWLEFRKAYDQEVGGPSGIYAIQHMLELNQGEIAYLSSGSADNLRWAKKAPAAMIAQVQFTDRQALIQGSAIEERDLLQPMGEPLALPNGLTVRGTLLRGKILKLWLYNAKLPARKGFKSLDFYPHDSRGVVTGTFRRNEQPVAMSFLDSREQAGIMYVVGTLQARIGGKSYDLKTYSYRNEWNEIESLLLLLRDRTSGKTTYGGGRVVDIHIPKGSPPQTITFDLNTAYSFLCAHSEYFNCPLVLTSKLDAELKFGEKYPPLFSRNAAKQ